MAFLADTNVASRWMQPNDPHYAECRAAVRILRARNEVVYITPQIVTEYWAVATRPVDVNGLGMTPDQVTGRVQLLLRNFPLLPEVEATFSLWRQLVESYGVVGRQVFDTRIVATMQAHGVTHLLTRNPAHFQRYSEIAVVQPQDVK